MNAVTNCIKLDEWTVKVHNIFFLMFFFFPLKLHYKQMLRRPSLMVEKHMMPNIVPEYWQQMASELMIALS